MDTFEVALEIGDSGGERYERVRALVDTGAAYTWVPGSMLVELGLVPSFRLPFVLADGRVVERDLTETRVRLDGEVGTTIVVFGDEGSGSLMGAYTLEGFGVSIDPINRRLVPIERFPMGSSRRPGYTLSEFQEGICGRR